MKRVLLNESAPIARSGTDSTNVSTFRLLGTSLGARFTNDTVIKLFEPFLPLIALGLGTSVVVMGWLVSIRSLMGLLTPLLGSIADRHGYRGVMRWLLLTTAAGVFVLAASATLWQAVIGMIIIGIGSSSFIPVLHAYLSAQLPYERRARGLGVVEYAWALAGIIGVSSAGPLIDRYGWRAPFWILGIGLLLAWLAFGALPEARGQIRERRGPAPALPERLRDFFHFESNARSAWGTALVNALNFFATVHVAIVFGYWLLVEYGLGAAGLGIVGMVIGIAELIGSVLVSLVVDRVGKRRALLLSTAGTAVAYLVLPLLNVGLIPAVLSLVLARFTFEVSIVSGITLLSEQVPAERGKLMALGAALSTIAIAIASVTGVSAYEYFGVWGLGPVSLVVALVSTGILITMVRDA